MPGKRMILDGGWFLQSSLLVNAADENVASGGFNTDGWYPADLPCTVLNALVKNGVYPDPRTGLNLFLIPDVSDEFNEKNDLAKYSHFPGQKNPWRDPWWYRTEFIFPEEPMEWQWLVFNSVNYRADVWLNGKQIAKSCDMASPFLRYKYDISDYVDCHGLNCLAVKIHCADHTGIPGTQLTPYQHPRTSEDFGRGIMKDVTINIAAEGYDCAPHVPDRMMGILQEVFIECTGPVDIRNPFVKAKLPLPELNTAALTVSAELTNASPIIQKGILSGKSGGGLKFEKTIEINPGETIEAVFSPEDYPELIIDNPRLWWPWGYGEQNLQELTLEFTVDGQDGQISDSENVVFGIREITKELYELDGEYGLRVHVNGQKIFCRGGYLQTDTLLDRDMMSRERFEKEIRYLREANLNTFSMEDIPNLPHAFFDLCDEYGMMYWNDFYQCHWLNQEGCPEDADLLEKCGIDIIKRYRNHPSIVMYMCMNEGAAAEDHYIRWRKSVVELDGTRLFIPSGYPEYDDGKAWPEWILPDTPAGCNDCIPKSYTWQQHSWYYDMVKNDRTWMFKIEGGSASLPPLESLRKFICDIDEPERNAPFPLNSTWAHHGANSYYEPYDAAIRRRFGEPESLSDYCRKAHIVTADQHRAMFEAVHHLKWDVTSGFMQWKLNSCWPDIQWQLYDYYLRPMVSFYYIKKACEPLHVQLNPVNNTVTVVNHLLSPQEKLNVRARVYHFDMTLAWEHSIAADIPADCFQDVLTIPHIDGLTPVYFVKLTVEGKNGREVSDNFYWLSSRQNIDDDTGCFSDLKKLPDVKLNISCAAEETGAEGIVRVKLENPTDKLAFFVRVVMTEGEDGEEVLPVYWDDNYFSMLPGEIKEVNASFTLKDLNGSDPFVRVDGWNIITFINKI